MNPIHSQLKQAFESLGAKGEVQFAVPPGNALGDIAIPCFSFAKEAGKSPAEVAKELAGKLESPLVEKAEAAGPYINITLVGTAIASEILPSITSTYGEYEEGKGKKVMVEYGCPNPLKAFHLGHLKNLITGESVARMFENAGYDVLRVNYQGDVGMHVAKAMWGILDWKDQFEAVREKPLKERVEFLGKAYAHGATHFEAGEDEKQEVIHYNDVVYEGKDESVMNVYKEARGWSLDYFDEIYTRLGTKYDEMYFEGDMYKRGIELVNEGKEKGVLKDSEGAVIFPGSEHGLHDRVFLNSKGFPTYEGKELALSEDRFNKHPDLANIIHVVGKEQADYFKVIFKTEEELGAPGAGKEEHLPGGFLQLKGDQKMSSRTGNIVTGDQLIFQVEDSVKQIQKESSSQLTGDKAEEIVKKVSVASLKYSMLKADISKDVQFDLEESVSTSGDSGPYLLYTVARIKHILKGTNVPASLTVPPELTPEEKALTLLLAEYPNVTKEALKSRDSSKIAKYLFELAQEFQRFYATCPVLQSEGDVQAFRLTLISKVEQVMEKGLGILGIETVEEM